MKKTVIAAALIAALTLAGTQTVSAHGDKYSGGNNYGPGYCDNYEKYHGDYTAEDQAAHKKFRDDTASVRREIVVKKSELQALMRQDNPDETKVARLTGEVYDLIGVLEKKAEAAGIDKPFAYGHHKPGMMHGYGMGRGGHMMDW